MSSGSNLVRKKCTCNYKCKHTVPGMQIVSLRTYYEHRHQDTLGNIHPVVMRQMQQATGSTSATTSTQSRQPLSNLRTKSRRVWCKCVSYCGGGRMVAPSTFIRHQLQQKKFGDLATNLGFPPQEAHEDVVSDENDGYNFSHEEARFDGLGNNCDEEMFEELTLASQILERCIELQALWDKFQAPIEFQDEMLQVLFGDMGGKMKGRRKKSSLSKLLVQLPSTWDGDLDGMRIPTCWEQLNSMYSELGMIEVQRFRLCTGSKANPHNPELLQPSKEDNYTKNVLYCLCEEDAQKKKKLKRDCLSCCEKCRICTFPRKDIVPFDYAPISQQLRLLTKSRTVCHELLRMWRNKERWLGKDPQQHPERIYDFWDGEKCRETQEFWNPNSMYELPVICDKYYCRKVYATFPIKYQVLTDCWNEEEGVYDFVCEKCRCRIRCGKKMCKGDPRNFALLLHSDGFQASRTTQKDCVVIEITILNAGKGSIVDILPVLFLPLSCKKLIKSSGDVFGTFLRPLVDELESLFVNGIELYYNYPLKYISSHVSTLSKSCQLHAMLMMVTGDHPAQCKIGLFKDGGQAFCRRDKAQATLNNRNENGIGRYFYDGNRYQARYPPPKRLISEMVEALSQTKRVYSQVEREEILRSAGLSGESILWRLYELYNFNLSTDLVYDVMHIFSLNLFQKFVHSLFKGSTNDMKRAIDAAVTEVFSVAPSSIRYGRWPKAPSKYHASFKAEENQKFIQWCLPHILGVVADIPGPLHDLGVLLIDIAHLFYNYSRDKGWSKKDIEAVKGLLLAWRVRSEESHGINSSPLEHVAGSGEILDDVYRHGMHDVFWCYSYEREVSKYVNISSNNQSNEISYTRYYRRRLFTRVFEHIQRDKDGLMPFERMLNEFHACLIHPEGYVFESAESCLCPTWHEHGILEASSVARAREIWKSHIAYSHDYACEKLLKNKGIAITKKKKQYRVPEKEEIQYAEHFWGIERNHGHFRRVTTYKRVFFQGELYSIGEEVVVKVDESTTFRVGVRHWKARIKSFFSMQHNREFMIFFSAEYYRQHIIAIDGEESLLIDHVTGMSILHRTRLSFNWNCIRPIGSLLHKFMALPRGPSLIAYETKDLEPRERLLSPGLPGCVPPWLEEDDIVLVQCNSDTDHVFKHAVLREVDVETKMLRLAWLQCDQRHRGVWKVELEEEMWRDWSICVKIACNWHVLGTQRVYLHGKIKQVPSIWKSPL